MKTLAQCIAVGIPVYRFGSPELEAMHEASRDPAFQVGVRGEGWYLSGDAWSARRTYPVYRQEYGQHAHGREYIVDHGSFHTLNRIEAGQVVPASEELQA